MESLGFSISHLSSLSGNDVSDKEIYHWHVFSLFVVITENT